MRYQFGPLRVKRIAIGCEYVVREADGPSVVIETPGDGWSVTRHALTRTVRVKPPTTTSGSNQIISGVVAGGAVTQVSNVRGNLSIGGGRVQVDGDDTTSKVTIYLPAGHHPDIVSL